MQSALLGLAAGVAAISAGPVTAAAPGERVEIYAAGSLRPLVGRVAVDAEKAGITIVPTFGGSGDLRTRIEQGATPDLFLSADMAAPQALMAKGRAIGAPLAFAQNRLCLIAPASLGLTRRNMVDKLLDPAVRLKTSRPVADPSGDYAFAMFGLIDKRHPGAAARLRANAERQMAVTAPAAGAGGNATAALFNGHFVDIAVTYCSATSEVIRAAPGLVAVAVPARFDPKPVFGLILLHANPAASQIVRFLLGKDGQTLVAASGLLRAPR
ncbi:MULTISPECIES: substrate-binding domain-containing protein [unclassified Sphingomonas]|uniref:substrate-binding domain-containing protein n=1 Tax=unclassified Sphingomonas TaxID=196159 RepID=UPI00226A938F|nr:MULTISPECIES: substrate-binding domain-containing protein [unclassified Sphingomonas]